MAALALGRSSRSRSSCASNDAARTRAPDVVSWSSHSFALRRAINRPTRRPDGASAEERLDAQHDPSRVLDKAVVATHQLLEHQHARRAVVDRLQRPDPQQLGQLLGVDAIALVRQLALTADVADHHPLNVRLQQVVQPLGLSPFSKATSTRDPAPRTSDRVARASVGTVALIVIAPRSSRTQATIVAWCTSIARC
jgi:hypothetical protein